MGLGAIVYCDCYEKGRVRVPPPQPELVYVDATGRRSLRWEVPGADQHRLYDWMKAACDHGPMGELVSHRLGNVALIGVLRERLSRRPDAFPVILTKVVYDGTHCGDHLDLDQIGSLAAEIESLRTIHCEEESIEKLLRQLERQMFELVDAAKRVGKPIAF